MYFHFLNSQYQKLQFNLNSTYHINIFLGTRRETLGLLCFSAPRTAPGFPPHSRKAAVVFGAFAASQSPLIINVSQCCNNRTNWCTNILDLLTSVKPDFTFPSYIIEGVWAAQGGLFLARNVWLCFWAIRGG